MSVIKWIKHKCAVPLCISAAILFGAAQAQEKTQARSYVLVHGAWVGEWYWDDLVDGLQAAGHRAVAVTLTGHGLRSDEGGAHVSIDHHAKDIVEAVQYNALKDVILVGHSYGGRPITGAWDSLRQSISHVVYVEAVAPVNDSEIAIPQDARSLQYIVHRYPAWVESGMIPVPLHLKQSHKQTLAPQSILSVYGEVILRNGRLPATPGTYVYAQESQAKIFRSYGKHLKEWRGWDMQVIPGGHSLSDEGFSALLDILLSIASDD